jgi:AraC family transcriptional regulator, transcriptional activator of pobA
MKNIPVRSINTNHTILIPTGKFSIRSIADVLKGDDLMHHMHRHDFYFILAIEKGSGIHEIDFERYDIDDYSIFFLRPAQVHQLELKAGCIGFLVEFDTTFYHPQDTVSAQRLKKATNKNLCRFEAARFEKLLNTLNNIHHEFSNKEEGYIEAIKSSLDLFFIEYIRQSKHAKKVNDTNVNDYTQDRFEELKGLLDANITTVKSVSQYADMLAMSVYQLNAVTKAAIGKTASELIDEHIVLEAKRYLLGTANQVKDIAFHLGYEDVSYFIRYFKKRTDYSPEAFRQKFK